MLSVGVLSVDVLSVGVMSVGILSAYNVFQILWKAWDSPFAKGFKMLFDVKKKCKCVQNKDKTQKRTNKETYWFVYLMVFV